MKKWIIRIVLLLIVITVTGFFVAKSYLTRDYLVAAIEKSINSRIQVKDVDINLYGLSGTVDLNDVIITQRDNAANEEIPHDQRDPIEAGDIYVKSATFNVSIWEILSKKILVERINFDGVTLNLTLHENGDTSIEKLFAKPISDYDTGEVEKPKKFNAKENEDFVTTINQINLSNVDINLVVEKTQLSVKGRGINIDLLDINVNPEQLDTVNDAKIKIGGTFDLQSLDSTQDYGKIITSGESDFTLFNTENGDLEPDMVVLLTIDEDSYLTSKVPSLSKIWGTTNMLNKLGIKALKIPDKAKFKNDQSIRVGYKLGISTLLDPLSIKVDDWELEALAQSWLGSGNDQHMLGVKLHVGAAISKKIGGLLGSSAASKLLGNLAGGNLTESLLENGKLTLHVESSGDLSNPKIRLKNKLPNPAENLLDGLLGGEDEDAQDSLKKAGENLLKGFFD